MKIGPERFAAGDSRVGGGGGGGGGGSVLQCLMMSFHYYVYIKGKVGLEVLI